MYSKTVLIVGCFILFKNFGDQAVNADQIIPKIYDEIGCKKINDTHPTSFECPDFTTYSKDKCYLKGKSFNVNDYIEESLLPNCRTNCKCVQYGNETAYINCANIECPEELGDRDWSCVSQYDNLTQCCHSREICGQAKIDSVKCKFGDKSYQIGEHIYPDDSCHKCICTEDFNNKTPITENPNCVKIDCGIELELKRIKDEGCIPIYYKTPTCCPIEYKCPSKDDAIESPTADENLTCKFGALTLKVGDKLKTDDKCLKCECTTPPYITCIKSNVC